MRVTNEWMDDLPMQQQSVLFLATRGPDGVRKHHPMKDVQRAYRASVLKAAYYGESLKFGEQADGFMSLDMFADEKLWDLAVRNYFDAIDELPHHFHMHLTHAAHILAVHHPDEQYRSRWRLFYNHACIDAHLAPEPDDVMLKRLGDWDRKHWRVEA